MNKVLYGLIESGVTDEFICPQDVVVVLGGGYYKGAKPSSDQLAAESEARLMKGIEVFEKCSAQWLVLSGRSKWGQDSREGELMRAIALRNGVPADQILIEAESRNTREHPRYIAAMKLVGKDSSLAVVTSPWHVRRAMREFRRIFPDAAAIASHNRSYPSDYSATILDWVPSALALERSTRPFHEYVGMCWYDILNLFDPNAGGSKDAHSSK